MRVIARASLAFAVLLASCEAHAAPFRELFKFSAGSGLFARPGVGHDGALYVGSGDGYVHALSAEGHFRWSYTVKGRVAAPPVEEATSGRIFVATSEARLYALEPDSQLRWVFPLPVAPKTELVLSPRGTLFFVGQDDHLYGVTTGGALSLRLSAARVRSAPEWLTRGGLGLILADELATLKGYGYERSSLGGVFAEHADLALDAERAVFACDGASARVLSRHGAGLSTASDCLSPPVRGDGFFAIAEARSTVRVLFADGSMAHVTLDAAPLRPIWDGARRRLILASATGAVRVLELGGESR